MAKKPRKQADASVSGPARDRKSRRHVLVLAALLGSLGLTSMLLVAIQPHPLVPGEGWILMAPESIDAFDRVFSTGKPIQPGRWKYIYIHHSATPSADALLPANGAMGDHFLIDNGSAYANGDIHVGHRWDQQRPASPQGATVADNCISICLVGDFDRSAPTPAQIRQLQRLVNALQEHFAIPARQVILHNRADSPAGIGSRFPVDQLSRALLN